MLPRCLKSSHGTPREHTCWSLLGYQSGASQASWSYLSAWLLFICIRIWQHGETHPQTRRPGSASADVCNQPAPSCRVEKLKLLSKLESAGILSGLENSGVTLEFIEKNKLLSKAEDLQLIKLVTDRCALNCFNLQGQECSVESCT